jgi:hypothetical protein
VELKNTNTQRCFVAGTGTLVKEKATYTAAQVTAGITLAKNANITCGSTTGQTTWQFTFNNTNGNTHRACNLQISGATNLDSVTCLNSSPTPTTTVPTSSLFCLLDGSNCGFTGNITHNGHDDTGIGQLGVAGSEKLTETTAPSCATGFDLLWADSTAHRLKECDNNGAAVQVVHSGVDVNTSDQVTATHLASPLPTAQGGTGQNSTAVFPASGTVGTGTGTTNKISKFTTGASGIQGDSSITDNGTVVSSTEPYAGVEAAAPSGIASSDIFYPDSTAHRWKMINNNGSAKTVAATDGDTFTNSIFASPQITGAIAAGSGFARGSVATCSIGAGVGAACGNTITWSSTLSSSTYTMLCEMDSPNTTAGTGNTGSKTTTTASVSSINLSAGTGLSSGTVRCIAIP